MKNKAFTLVELLGVIVLLGILGVVIIPKVGDSITNSKETAYITQEEQIKKAANDFIVDNIELFDNTNTITIKLGVLKQKGYLPINIKNPKTRKNISNESTITITKTNEKFEITLNLIDLIEVTENIDNNSPIIVLNGNYVEYINVNSNETEINNNLIQNGAKAYSSTGEELTEITTQIKIGETEKTSIKTNTLDTYEITYTVTDNGKTTSATRTVIIRDTEAPTITLPKETTITASQVNGYNLREGVTVTDNYDYNPTLTINSGLSDIPGKYVVTYTATDSSGNQTTERRVIIVENTPTYIIKGKTTPSNNNTPTMENPVTYYGLGRDNYIDVIVTDGNNQFNESDYSKLDDYPDTYGNYKSAKIQLKPNTTYKVNIKRYNNFDGKNNGYLLMSNIPQINGYAWTSISHESRPNEALTNYVYTTTSDGLLYIGYFYQMTQEKLNTIWSNTDVAIEEVTTSTRIDLTGHDPLMCSNDICDYIDYENSVIVRYIKKYTFIGNEQFKQGGWVVNDTEITKGVYWTNSSLLGTYPDNFKIRSRGGFCTHFPTGDIAYTKDDTLRYGLNGNSSPPYLSFRIPIDTDMNAWTTEQYNAGTPLIAYYVLNNPEFESINLPQVNLYWNSNTFVTDGYVTKDFN